MKRSSFLAAALLAVTALLAIATEVQAQHVAVGVRVGPGYGYYRPYGYGYYRYGYPHYYGWYRPYPVIGVGIGLYAPYYGSYVYPVDPAYVVYPAPAVVAGTTPAAPSVAAQQPPADKPPPDNAGHLQLIVPENAEVHVDNQKLTQTGTTREIVSPPVKPGARYTYKISVRYTDASGKVVEDVRDIHFHANDWFAIDFTRPVPPQAATSPPPMQLQIVPSKQ